MLLNTQYVYSGKDQPKKPEIDDNDYEALDAETMKARDWDVYKEDNPKGWGMFIKKLIVPM